MQAIVNVDKNWGIGRDNCLLFRLKEDLAFFRATTTGKVIIVGRKTLLSFPNGKPLPNRTTILLSTALNREDCLCATSVGEVLDLAKNYPAEDVFVAGGAEVYRALLPYCSAVLVTKVDKEGDADRFFPNLDEDGHWTVAETVATITEGDTTATIYKYVRTIPR